MTSGRHYRSLVAPILLYLYGLSKLNGQGSDWSVSRRKSGDDLVDSRSDASIPRRKRGNDATYGIYACLDSLSSYMRSIKASSPLASVLSINLVDSRNDPSVSRRKRDNGPMYGILACCVASSHVWDRTEPSRLWLFCLATLILSAGIGRSISG